jgi:hypothetical protein
MQESARDITNIVFPQLRRYLKRFTNADTHGGSWTRRIEKGHINILTVGQSGAVPILIVAQTGSTIIRPKIIFQAIGDRFESDQVTEMDTADSKSRFLPVF